MGKGVGTEIGGGRGGTGLGSRNNEVASGSRGQLNIFNKISFRLSIFLLCYIKIIGIISQVLMLINCAQIIVTIFFLRCRS